MKNVAKILVLGSSFFLLTGCSGVMATNAALEDDHVLVYGSSEGIRSFFDGANGLITNGKASADTQDTPYYQLRRETIRAKFGNYSKRSWASPSVGSPSQEQK